MTRSWLLAWPVLVLASCQPSRDDPDPIVAPDPPGETTVAPGAVPASPWEAAAARGVVLRAVGNEPGWFMEVDRGPAPTLRATLDYGDRTLTVQGAQVLDDPPGYRGTTAGGTSVLMQVRREACSDGMSDRSYEASVTLRVDDATYRGCGRFLNPIRR